MKGSGRASIPKINQIGARFRAAGRMEDRPRRAKWQKSGNSIQLLDDRDCVLPPV